MQFTAVINRVIRF